MLSCCYCSFPKETNFNLLGVSLGVPSSATTDSNNSNETAGSPSNSIISGSSPVQSPIQLNCSSSTTNNNLNNINNLNCSSDSTSVDITAADKRNKNETNASTKVKVRFCFSI